MMINFNGPEIGEADIVLKSALDLHFKGQPWHFTVKRNIFKSPGKTVTKTMLHHNNVDIRKHLQKKP